MTEFNNKFIGTLKSEARFEPGSVKNISMLTLVYESLSLLYMDELCCRAEAPLPEGYLLLVIEAPASCQHFFNVSSCRSLRCRNRHSN